MCPCVTLGWCAANRCAACGAFCVGSISTGGQGVRSALISAMRKGWANLNCMVPAEIQAHNCPKGCSSWTAASDGTLNHKERWWLGCAFANSPCALITPAAASRPGGPSRCVATSRLRGIVRWPSQPKDYHNFLRSTISPCLNPKTLTAFGIRSGLRLPADRRVGWRGFVGKGRRGGRDQHGRQSFRRRGPAGSGFAVHRGPTVLAFENEPVMPGAMNDFNKVVGVDLPGTDCGEQSLFGGGGIGDARPGHFTTIAPRCAFARR